MKMYKAIFFDLDGTLLPMNMEEFTGGYFKFLCKKLAPFNLDNNLLIDVIWKGTGAMVMNDGSSTNQQVFWDYFAKAMDCPVDEIKPCCDQFYSQEFQQAKCFTGDNPLAVEAVRVAREKADIVALTTNPLFPMDGQIQEWAGLVFHLQTLTWLPPMRIAISASLIPSTSQRCARSLESSLRNVYLSAMMRKRICSAAPSLG